MERRGWEDEWNGGGWENKWNGGGWEDEWNGGGGRMNGMEGVGG